MFCVAGVYSTHDGTDLMSLVDKMLHDCIEWCRHMNVGSVYFETEDWRGVSWNGDHYPDLRICTVKCAERVNCVVKGLVNSCTGGNVMFLRKEGLPQGLGRLLALEGRSSNDQLRELDVDGSRFDRDRDGIYTGGGLGCVNCTVWAVLGDEAAMML
nr:uncharacterized protein LOC109147873 [Ipomoea trifida]